MEASAPAAHPRARPLLLQPPRVLQPRAASRKRGARQRRASKRCRTQRAPKHVRRELALAAARRAARRVLLFFL
jgi:hypothetical protein